LSGPPFAVRDRALAERARRLIRPAQESMIIGLLVASELAQWVAVWHDP
jgi:hypothetical protein